MVNSKGKLKGDTPPNKVLIVCTTVWVEPFEKQMMEAPNPMVGGQTNVYLGKCLPGQMSNWINIPRQISPANVTWTRRGAPISNVSYKKWKSTLDLVSM